jgi:hypothetical protein
MTAPQKVRAGRCGVRADVEGRWRCACDSYQFARRISDWDTCVCGHTQQAHALIEMAGG